MGSLRLWGSSKASQRRHGRDSPGNKAQAGGSSNWRRGSGGRKEDEEEAGGEDEGEGGRPSEWPSKVIFSQKLRWGASAGADKDFLKRRQLPGIRVQYITDDSHPLKGQYGVWGR